MSESNNAKKKQGEDKLVLSESPTFHYANKDSTIDNDFISDGVGFSDDGKAFWLLHGELPLSYGSDKSQAELSLPRMNDYIGFLWRSLKSNYSEDKSLQGIVAEALLEASKNKALADSGHGASIAMCRYVVKDNSTELEYYLLGDVYLTVASSSGFITIRDKRPTFVAMESRLKFLRNAYHIGEQYRNLDDFCKSRRDYLATHRQHRNRLPQPYYSLAASDVSSADDPIKFAEEIVSQGVSDSYAINVDSVNKQRAASSNYSFLITDIPSSKCTVIDGRVLLWSGVTHENTSRVRDGSVRGVDVENLMARSLPDELANIDKDMRFKYGFSDCMTILRSFLALEKKE